MHRPPVLLAAIALAIATAASSTVSAASAPAVPTSHVRVVSATPPGQSGFFGAAGQASYEVTQDPSDFGPHVDDQREMYWTHHFGNAGFTKSGTPERPRRGVAIYRDARGVPSVYGTTAANVWWGAGYAIAQDRLFEMDGVRRTASTGPPTLPRGGDRIRRARSAHSPAVPSDRA